MATIIEKKLIKVINNDNVVFFEKLLNNPAYETKNSNYYILMHAIKKKHIPIIKILLKDKNTDPIQHNNYALGVSCDFNLIEIMHILLKDKRILPEFNDNVAMLIAHSKGNQTCIDTLWKYQNVKKTLQKSHPRIFNELMVLDMQDKIEDF